MKKMSILFSDVTILNFTFLFKLIKRYYKVNAAILLIVVSIGIIKYLFQNEIYSTTTEFKNVAGTSNSPTTAIATLLGENNSSLMPTEIVGIGQSLDFHQRLALSLYNDPDFSRLNFNDPKGTKNQSHKEIFGHCGNNQKCIVGVLRSLVPRLYSISQNNRVRTKYIATARSLNAVTAAKILQKLKELIVQDRVETIRHSLSEQRKISQTLVKEKRGELERFNIGSISFQSRAIDYQLDELSSTAKNFNSLLGVMRQKLSHSEAKFNHTQNTLQNEVSPEEKEIFEKVSKLKTREAMLQDNIGKLEIAGESSDIVAGLKQELDATRLELNSLGDVSKFGDNYNQFIEERSSSSRNERFNYDVIMSEVKTFKNDYLKMVDSKKGLIRKKLSLEKRLEELKPSFEYLRLLEGQNAKLQLLESTVVSDLVFDKFDSPVGKFKRASLSKTFVFSIFVTLFLIVMFVFVRYYYDPVLFDELELKYNFSDLPTLGTTPKIF